MIVFPNAKINLGLHVTEKRHDGFHNIETIFYPLPFTDILELIYLPSENPFTCKFTQTGLPVEGESNNNLCIKALMLLKPFLPGTGLLQMHLHKIIPMGAGLGGGSADGTFSLLAINKLFNLSISDESLMEYALRLGSDCPFFIYNKPCFAKQRGEMLSPVELNLSPYKLVIVNPGIHVNTGWAFSNLSPRRPEQHLEDIIQNEPDTWKHDLVNDFEQVVFNSHPQLVEIKKTLYDAGAIYASMSGSGSNFFGLFRKNQTPVQLLFPQHYLIKEIDL